MLELRLLELGLLLLTSIKEALLGLFLLALSELCNRCIQNWVSVAKQFFLELIILDWIFLSHLLQVLWVNLSWVVSNLDEISPISTLQRGNQTQVPWERINIIDNIRSIEISKGES